MSTKFDWDSIRISLETISKDVEQAEYRQHVKQIVRRLKKGDRVEQKPTLSKQVEARLDGLIRKKYRDHDRSAVSVNGMIRSGTEITPQGRLVSANPEAVVFGVDASSRQSEDFTGKLLLGMFVILPESEDNVQDIWSRTITSVINQNPSIKDVVVLLPYTHMSVNIMNRDITTNTAQGRIVSMSFHYGALLTGGQNDVKIQADLSGCSLYIDHNRPLFLHCDQKSFKLATKIEDPPDEYHAVFVNTQVDNRLQIPVKSCDMRILCIPYGQKFPTQEIRTNYLVTVNYSTDNIPQTVQHVKHISLQEHPNPPVWGDDDEESVVADALINKNAENRVFDPKDFGVRYTEQVGDTQIKPITGAHYVLDQISGNIVAV